MPQADADDVLAAPAQGMDERQEVAVAGDEDVGAVLLAIDEGVHRIDDHVHVDEVLAEVVEGHGRLHGEAGGGDILHQLLVLAQVAGVGATQDDPAAGALLDVVDDEVDVKVEIGVARANYQVVEVEKDGDIIGHW